ncbi:rRNA maturation RNase YbeY [Zobellia amurskyensis]|uniref:Endoribonuclease YbeY n=1 Tax=Zobellia amurskyensis TaxID=248905 RepID=A0A7X3D180_9FLAO|nr:rRNA maturation RNase YbeY [Zobellia amurskyensis]MUH35151.1 rRNA maturation RNase YbeY [Zobellia amurskyensis]
MIEFHYKTDFLLENEEKFSSWLNKVILSENGELNQVDYVFCSDEEVLEMNEKYLNHDTYTDILTFDYTEGKLIGGDIFISIDRVRDNADQFNISFEEELLRVMAHGVLHLFGFKDKSEEEISIMRSKENEKIQLFHVEQ